MSARYEISEGELDVLAISGPEGTRYIDGEEIEARVIRQQSADIAELRAELQLCCELKREYQERAAVAAEQADQLRADLAAAVAERDRSRSNAQDLTECAMKNIPADWRPGYAWTDDCVMNVLAEYVGDIQSERDALRARLAAIDSAPTVALLGIDKDGVARATYFSYPHASAHIAQLDAAFGDMTIRELIARPAKD